jgi:type I pantothenate kinase
VPSGYVAYPRGEWLARFGRSDNCPAGAPPPLGPSDLAGLAGAALDVASGEVEAIYQSVAALVSHRAAAAAAAADGAGRSGVGGSGAGRSGAFPYLVGIAGGVAAGKSTTARILQFLLARWPGHPMVEVVATDGFLLPNAELAARGILARKGFPESYDVAGLVRFLSDVKAGQPEVHAPVYSHDSYDIVPGRTTTVHRPDILVVEGLNVLQSGPDRRRSVAGIVDFSIYLDADNADIERWYVERFLALRAAEGADASFYRRFAGLADDDVADLARRVWRGINAVNLEEHIAPTRFLADLILEKGPDHAVRRVLLRTP